MAQTTGGTRTSGRQRNRNLDDTRAELLAAGRELVLQQGFDTLLNLSFRDVARHVGRSPGALYQVWRKQDAYHRDLAEYLFDNDVLDAHAAVAAAAAEGLVEDADLNTVVRVGGANYLAQQLSERGFEIFVRYWSVAARDPELAEVVRRCFDRFHDTFRALYVTLLEHFGLEPAPPYTVDDITVAISSVADGFALRSRIEPDRCRTIEIDNATWNLFTCTLMAVIHGMTRPADPPYGA